MPGIKYAKKIKEVAIAKNKDKIFPFYLPTRSRLQTVPTLVRSPVTPNQKLHYKALVESSHKPCRQGLEFSELKVSFTDKGKLCYKIHLALSLNIVF